MTPEDHPCFIEGCPEPAGWGYRPNRSVPYKWACKEHRLQLTKGSPAPKPVEPAPAKQKPHGGLFDRG